MLLEDGLLQHEGDCAGHDGQNVETDPQNVRAGLRVERRDERGHLAADNHHGAEDLARVGVGEAAGGGAHLPDVVAGLEHDDGDDHGDRDDKLRQ